MMNKRPYVIAVDGVNGAGKTTICAKIMEQMAGSGVSIGSVRLPGASPLPVNIALRKILDEHGGDMSPLGRALIYMADFAEYCEKLVQNNILDVDILLTDRSILSFLVHQQRMDKVGEELGRCFVNMIKSNLFPDLLLHITGGYCNRLKNSPGEVSKSVGGYGDKDEEWFKQLKQAYYEVYYSYAWPGGVHKRTIVNDGTMHIDVLVGEIINQTIKPRLEVHNV